VPITQIFDISIFIQVFSIYNIIFLFSNARFVISKHPEIVTYPSKSNIRYNCDPRLKFNQQTMNDCTSQFVPPVVFRSNGNSTNRENQFFLDKFKSAFIAVHFTHLNINCENIHVNMLLKIIRLLPYLKSLKVSSLPIIKSDWFFDNHGKIHSSTLINNKITEVSLEKINDIEQVYFILYLCHRMEHLQLDVPKDMDLHMLVRFILKKPAINTRFLNSLCLSIPNANEDMIDQLQKMLESEKLLFNFNIQCICNSIFLNWKKSCFF
jgi:hypothetical protein